ncbi:hypothetical protein J7643_00585 [bacterium]|nr:hypothetical protein [bacterium]
MSRAISRIAITMAALLLSGCATVQVQHEVLQGEAPLYQPTRLPLGVLSVRPLSRWRPDQKEVPAREKIARAAIEAVFRNLPSGSVAEIRPFEPFSAQSDLKLAEARTANIDTVVTITVEELGPQLYLSIPVLWSTYSDVRFQLQAVRTQTGETVLDVKHKRLVGGPFELRGVQPLQAEMETALREVLGQH